MELIKNLRITAQLDGELLEILMKAVGVGFLAEIAGMVCTDAGNGTLGKVLQFLGSAVILWMSIPQLQRLQELVASILGEI